MVEGGILSVNLKSLLLGSSSRLRNIVRFSNSHRIQDESVAEHSFGTALYCLVIGEELRQGGLQIDVELSVKRALVHDVEESHSGDFIRTFKHSDPVLAKAIDEAAERFSKKIFEEMAPPKSADVLYELWKKAKDRTLEGMLVELSDFLSVVSYVLREAQMGNRALLDENADSMGEYANKFNAPRYEFLATYVQEVHKMLFKEIAACARRKGENR